MTALSYTVSNNTPHPQKITPSDHQVLLPTDLKTPNTHTPHGNPVISIQIGGLAQVPNVAAQRVAVAVAFAIPVGVGVGVGALLFGLGGAGAGDEGFDAGGLSGSVAA